MHSYGYNHLNSHSHTLPVKTAHVHGVYAIKQQLDSLCQNLQNKQALMKTIFWYIQFQKIYKERIFNTIFFFHLTKAVSTRKSLPEI